MPQRKSFPEYEFMILIFQVVYFTAIFPYVVLLIFVINGLTLEGASLGVQFYIGSGSDWRKLSDGKVRSSMAYYQSYCL